MDPAVQEKSMKGYMSPEDVAAASLRHGGVASGARGSDTPRTAEVEFAY